MKRTKTKVKRKAIVTVKAKQLKTVTGGKGGPPSPTTCSASSRLCTGW